MKEKDITQKVLEDNNDLGGLDNHGILIEGSLEDIAGETHRIIKGFGKKGLMIGADCTVPADIDINRLRAAVMAAREV